ILYFFFSSRRRHTRFSRDWSSDVCSSDLTALVDQMQHIAVEFLGHGEDCVAVARQGGRMILAYPVLKWMVQCGWPSHEGTLHLRSEERRVGKEWGSRRRRENEDEIRTLIH